jgi:hypothetical protein
MKSKNIHNSIYNSHLVTILNGRINMNTIYGGYN